MHARVCVCHVVQFYDIVLCVLSSFEIKTMKKRKLVVLCFVVIYVCLLLAFYLLHAIVWFVFCNCAISWSHSLVFDFMSFILV